MEEEPKVSISNKEWVRECGKVDFRKEPRALSG